MDHTDIKNKFLPFFRNEEPHMLQYITFGIEVLFNLLNC
jgi:hypothetical protein